MEDRYVKERKREHIPDQFKWDLKDICLSDDAWADDRQKLTAGLNGITAFCGKLDESPDQLFRCLQLLDSLRKECTRLACYASMKSDLDTRDAKYLAMDQEMGQLGSDLSSLSSYIEPEILRMGEDTVDRFIGQEPKLAIYRHIFNDILRKKEHGRGRTHHRGSKPHGGFAGKH
jgi:oligoendopeptidase F